MAVCEGTGGRRRIPHLYTGCRGHGYETVRLKPSPLLLIWRTGRQYVHLRAEAAA